MDNLKPPIVKPRTMTEKIMDAACMYYSVEKHQLQQPEYMENRKIVCYLLREHAMLKLKIIGGLFNYPDHSWASRAIDEIRSVKNNYTHISHDVKNIMAIVDNLV